jgi:V8-like Glu-specific endopeptidase
MGPRRVITARRVVGLAVAVSLAVGGTVAVAEVALAKDQTSAGAGAGARTGAGAGSRAGAGAGAGAGTVYMIGAAARAAAVAYWTPARIAAATGAGAIRAGAGSGAGTGTGKAGSPAAERQDAVMGGAASLGPPRGTPESESFGGVPTVGALLYTKANSNHFCTASVINSTVGSLVLTAAHCVFSSSGYSQHLEFIPGYDGDSPPYGVWPVTQITVAKGWRDGGNPDLDVAFLNVVPPPNSVGPIEQVTGALQIAFALPDAQHITVIGYNNTDQKPIMCSTTSFRFRHDQMEFYCRGFWYGTSGGPWILKYDAGNGTGTVYGVIGGYEAGGDVSWASYAAALEQPAQQLLAQAEASAHGTGSSAARSGTAKPGTSTATQVTVDG